MNIISSIILLNNNGGVHQPEPSGWLEGWNRRKAFSVSASSSVESILELAIYNTTDTDTTTEIYLGSNVRDDWGDLRFTTIENECLPWMILQKDTDHIKVAVNLGTVQSGNFYIYYDGPAADIFKIAHVTDIHYMPGETNDNRYMSLDYIDNFLERLQTYQPHLLVKGGDDIGDLDKNESTRLGYMQDVLDHIAGAEEIDPAPEILYVAMGNHDFDYTSFSNTLAVYHQDWMEDGVLYGLKDVGPYIIISLDANYSSSTGNHLSNSHQGWGYVNEEQLEWLEDALSAADKPVIIFVHEPLSEMDTKQFTLTKQLYHTDNRSDVRAIIEASQKVICVIQGHTHYSRIDCINGIPYIDHTNIGNTGQFGEQPASHSGKWGLIEIDASAKTVRAKTEALISGEVKLIYDQTYGWGPTIFTEDVSQAPERVFALGYAATYEKSSIFRDPVMAYSTDSSTNSVNIYKYPTNLNIPDPHLSENTIKVAGQKDTPDFGRIQWYFAPESGTCRIRFSARVSSVKTKTIKFGDSNIVASPAFRMDFNNSGNLISNNGGSATTLFAYSTNTWYDIEIVANMATDKFSIWVDGELEADNFSFTNNVTSIDRVEIVTESGNIFIDNLRKFPYTDLEITEILEEETA